MANDLRLFLKNLALLEQCSLSEDDLKRLAGTLEDDYLTGFLSSVILESEEILAIDPANDPKTILETAARAIVKNLGAEAASLRLFEPKSLRMINFGSFGFQEGEREDAIPARESIAGRVVEEKRSIPVPSILKNDLYRNKDIVRSRGFHSLLAVPLLIPSFVSEANDLLGSLQIYYTQDDRHFHRLEILRAEMLARRVSHVLAKKKILDLYSLNMRKEKIVDHIFVKLSNRQAIKLKDIFIMLINELGELLQLQGCSLFSVTDDQRHIYLETAHPIEMTYHEPGHIFTIDHHPYFQAAVHCSEKISDSQHERVADDYILLKDPLQSRLTSAGLKEFVRAHQIHSVLLIPIRVHQTTRHVLAIYATEHKQFFTRDEIELFTFFGKEIMKAAKLEFLGETLHDFKNPAVAVAGLAARSRKLLDSPDLDSIRGKLINYFDMIARETARLQDIALTQTGEGREERLDLGLVARRRFELNRAVIREDHLDHINVAPAVIEENLIITCPRFGLERVIDNLLHNATKAIPLEGGELAMSCWHDDDMACLEVRNSGEINADILAEIRAGTAKGRGVHIIRRFITINHGTVDIEGKDGATRFRVRLPMAR